MVKAEGFDPPNLEEICALPSAKIFVLRTQIFCSTTEFWEAFEYFIFPKGIFINNQTQSRLMKTHSSWSQKLAKTNGLPKKVKIKGKKTMVVPSPKDIDSMMKKVKKGKVITINSITKALSKKYKTDTCCPLTTGIFAWIAANASNEQKEQGKKTITPFWRTIKSDGSLNSKYPGGESYQARMLATEGHKISKKGKKQVVLDFEKKIQKL